MAKRASFFSRIEVAEKLSELLTGFLTACFLMFIFFLPSFL